MNATVANNLDDLLSDLGEIPAGRVVADPAPGTATFDDAVAAIKAGRGVELLHRTLVEKAMGLEESVLGSLIIARLLRFVQAEGRGVVSGEQGFVRLLFDRVRGPDVAFFESARWRDGDRGAAVPALIPNFVVEVLSRSNTRAEMHQKRTEYFAAGVEEAWFVDPADRSIAVYRSVDGVRVHRIGDTIAAGGALAGFELSVEALFDEFDAHDPG